MQIHGMHFTPLPYLLLFTSDVSESEENLIVNHISFTSMFALFIAVVSRTPGGH